MLAAGPAVVRDNRVEHGCHGGHAQVREMPLFSTKDHPNTVAAAGNDTNHLWVLLHNLGEVSAGRKHPGM
jgi:hypothetical protein